MSPEQFDALMDLIDHKIATAIKHGAGFKTRVLEQKAAALKESLVSENESAPTAGVGAVLKTRSELDDDLRRLLVHKGNVEQADGRCYTNGRMRAIDDEIASIRSQIKKIEEAAPTHG